MVYGTRLKEQREKLSLTQKNIATLIEVTENGYGQFEREHTIIPTKHLNTICNYFNVSFDYIFGFTTTLNYSNSKKEINKIKSGKRLKNLRKENKLTQEKLASILNVSRTTITEYERGTNIIATPFLYTICKNYNISADYLLGKINTPN